MLACVLSMYSGTIEDRILQQVLDISMLRPPTITIKVPSTMRVPLSLKKLNKLKKTRRLMRTVIVVIRTR